MYRFLNKSTADEQSPAANAVWSYIIWIEYNLPYIIVYNISDRLNILLYILSMTAHTHVYIIISEWKSVSERNQWGFFFFLYTSIYVYQTIQVGYNAKPRRRLKSVDKEKKKHINSRLHNSNAKHTHTHTHISCMTHSY